MNVLTTYTKVSSFVYPRTIPYGESAIFKFRQSIGAQMSHFTVYNIQVSRNKLSWCWWHHNTPKILFLKIYLKMTFYLKMQIAHYSDSFIIHLYLHVLSNEFRSVTALFTKNVTAGLSIKSFSGTLKNMCCN